ncbi:zinc finger, CCHC-type containing protein, partial [Tanacetum coccineum]
MLYTLQMHPSKSQSEHIDEFHKLVGDLAAIDTAISDMDQVLLLLTSLPSSYDNFMEALLYGRDTLKLEDVLATLNSRELQKMTKAKGDVGKGLYVRGRFSQIDIEQGKDSARSKSHERSSRLKCYICQFKEHFKRDCPRYNHKKSQGLVWNEDQISGSGVDRYGSADGMPCMGDRIKAKLDVVGHSKKEGFTVKMQSGKIKVIKGSLVVLSRTKRANCIYTLDGQAVTRKTLKGRKQFGEYQTGWKIKTSNEDHTFEVEPHGNVDHVVGSQEVQTQDLIYYHSARDREQHLAWELFSYKEDNNEATFAVAAVDKIYAHDSLTFNNTVAYEVISKWKAGLKDDIDARSDVYVLSNGCRKCSDESDDYYWEYTLDRQGLEWKYSEGVTVQVLQREVGQTLLEGHSILS